MSLIKLSLCFAVLVSAQVCLAGPTTTPAPFTIASFSEVIANAQKSINDATTHIQHMLGLPDVKNVDQIVGALKNSSTAFSKSINDVITSVKVEVDPNAKAAAAAFQKFFDQVNKTTEEFRKKIPELQVSDLEKTWTKSLNSIVDEGSKLKTALEKEAPHAQESLTKAVQNILETASKTANSFAEQVHETVGHNKHPDHAAHHKA